MNEHVIGGGMDFGGHIETVSIDYLSYFYVSVAVI